MDCALVRKTVLVNQNVIQQLDGENITNLPMILSLERISEPGFAGKRAIFLVFAGKQYHFSL